MLSVPVVAYMHSQEFFTYT